MYIHPILYIKDHSIAYTVEPPNNGHGGYEHFVHCLEVVPSSEVEMYGQLMAGGKQFVRPLIGVSIIGGFTVIYCILLC